MTDAVEISELVALGTRPNSTRKIDTFVTALLNTVHVKLYRSSDRQIFSHLTGGNLRNRNRKYCSLGFVVMPFQTVRRGF